MYIHQDRGQWWYFTWEAEIRALPDWASEPWSQELATKGSRSRKMRGLEDNFVKQLLDGKQELESISVTGSQVV